MFKMNTKVSVVADNSPAILMAINELKRNEVLVGVPAQKAARNAEEGRGQPINNAALAYIHNYGSPAANIPARPFMEPGIKNGQAAIEANLKSGADSAFELRAFKSSLGELNAPLIDLALSLRQLGG